MMFETSKHVPKTEKRRRVFENSTLNSVQVEPAYCKSHFLHGAK